MVFHPSSIRSGMVAMNGFTRVTAWRGGGGRWGACGGFDHRVRARMSLGWD